MNIISNITPNMGKEIQFSGLFSRKKTPTASNLAPLEKDTLCFSKKEPAKAPVKGFSAVAAGVVPLFTNDSSVAIKALEDFENNEINHIRLQNELINAGAKAEYLPQIFNKITSFMPDFKPKECEIRTGKLYRFIGKEEFDKLVNNKDVEARLAYNGNCFDVTTNPVLNHNDFARVKFKCNKNSENVELHDDLHEYYRLHKSNYSIDDIEEIDRILPNGYISVYKAK